ncbi:MAG TPA: CpaF family protein [Gemmatimonadaceae bacterium]|nr:CpaF family protein [Gemmatimonadaceae bacterium]
MSLRDRLTRRQNGGVPTPAPEAPALVVAGEGRPPSRTPSAAVSSGMYGGRKIETEPLTGVDRVKLDLHRKLVERLDLEALEQISDDRLINSEIRAVVTELLREESTPLTVADRENIIEQVLYEITGLGPLEPLFRDLTISDILVNGSKEIFIERHGKLTRVSATFRDDAHVIAVIDRIVSRVGRRVDESSPMVDARLPDGSRVNAIIPPLAIDGPVLSIRRFGADLSVERLIENGTMTQEMSMMFEACVRARLNILISGGTGAGKTTLLNAMTSYIPSDQRIITIEDAAELRLQQEHVVRLETRPPNAEGQGEVRAADLLKNALRMRPDRIIVGEVRSAEALDMLQAMNTGHEGSLSTVHANSPRDALSRLETMILMAGSNLPDRAMREQIASALDLVIQVSRLADGTRRVVSVVEITGMEGQITASQEIYRFKRHGIGPDGKVLGQFEATGIRPAFSDRLAVAGVDLPANMFAEGTGR